MDLKLLTANFCIQKSILKLQEDTSIQKATELFDQYGISCAPVFFDQTLTGWLSSTDILHHNFSKSYGLSRNNICEIMSHHIISVDTNTPYLECIRLMAKNNISQLAVIHNNHFEGIISSHDIIHFFQQNNSIDSFDICQFTISEVINYKQIFVIANDTIFNTLKIFDTCQIHALPVFNQTHQIIGIITQKQLIHLLTITKSISSSLYELPIENIITPLTISVQAHQSICTGIKMLSKYRIHHLIVNNKKNKFIGLLSGIDILKKICHIK